MTWRNTILVGDVREQLRTLPDESVHCVVTSPPYWGLRDYGTASWEGGDADCEHKATADEQNRWSERASTLVGTTATQTAAQAARYSKKSCPRCGAKRVDDQLGLEPTPDEYVRKMVAVFREVRRALRDDGTLWLNLGDSYGGSGRGPTGATGIGNQVERQGFNTAAAHRHGLDPISGVRSKDLVGIPWRVAFALQADGWWLRSDIIWSKPNPMPESVTDRPTKAHEYVFLLSKSATYYYDHEAIKEKASSDTHARTRKLRATGNETSMPTAERNGIRPPGVGPKGAAANSGIRYNESFSAAVVDVLETRNKRSVWEVTTQPYPEAHFATYPEALVLPCIQAGTSEHGCCSVCGAPWTRVVERSVSLESGSGRAGNTPHGKWEGMHEEISGSYDIRMGPVVHSQTTGWEPTCKHEAPIERAVVLDPFMGSGTTGLVAYNAGRDFVGIELNPAYAEMARRRIGTDRGRLF